VRSSWFVFCASFLACKGPMAKIDAVRDGLASDDLGAVKEATDDFPVCKEPFTVLPEKGCFQEIATAFGSKTGFRSSSPDQASAATVALVLIRERRGDWFAGADAWMGSLRSGKGPGADALRLAVARQMAAAAPDVGKKVDEEKDALAAMKAIANAIPGACATYGALAAGVDAASMPPEMTPDHSACVQKDLGREGGPGGTYGRGTWRAAEGAAALWREEAHALKDGLANMEGTPRSAVDGKLATINDATAKIALKKVPREDAWIADIAKAHADAGVPIAADAGASKTDAEARPVRP
jgi:hypothetical protein